MTEEAPTTLKAFQPLMGHRLVGPVEIDATRVRFQEYERLGQWIADVVLCRFGPKDETAALTVRYV